jgi:hypothetical protein
MPTQNVNLTEYTARLVNAADPSLEHGGSAKVVRAVIAAASARDAWEMIGSAAEARGVAVFVSGRIHSASRTLPAPDYDDTPTMGLSDALDALAI